MLLFCYSILRYCQRSVGLPAADGPAGHSSGCLCAGHPDTALNAGHCRLLTKRGERPVFVCVSESSARLKIACPPVNAAAAPLKTAGPGSCLHWATWKLILSLCRYLVTTPPLRTLFVACFVQAPSRRQSQPHKKSSFWIHWARMNTENVLFCPSVHKLVLTHWALSVCLKRCFMEHFLLLPLWIHPHRADFKAAGRTWSQCTANYLLTFI